MKYFITIIQILIVSTTWSQKSFIIRDDLGHVANIAFMAAESEESYHVIGLTVESDTSRQLPFVLDIKKDGSFSPTDYTIFRDSSAVMFMNLNNKKFQTDNLIEFGVTTLDGQYIIEYDTDFQSISLKESILFVDRKDTTIHHYMPFKNGYLLGGSTESVNFGGKRDYIIINQNSDSSFILRPNEPGFSELCRRIIQVNELTYCAVISTNTAEVTFASIKLLIFSDKGEILNLIETGIESYGVEDAIIDSNGNFIISSYDFIKLNSDPNFDIGLYTPYLLKINGEGETQWKKTYGDHIKDTGRLSKYASIIESSNKDAYVIAGSDFISTDDPIYYQSHATLAKFSLDGDSIWYRKYATIDTIEDFFHVFNDVIATQDGGYLAVGDQTYFNTDEGRTSNSMLIVKTNSEGLVVPDTTSSVVTLHDTPQFDIFPNPSSDYLYINKENSGNWMVSIFDMSGKRLLIKELQESKITYMLDLKMFTSGTYVLRFENGETIYSEKIIVE